MKILWIKSDFLHPTNRGGQIRTLEILRRLHTRHEVHYVAFAEPGPSEGLDRSPEYCTRSYPVFRRAVHRGSPRFFAQVAGGLFSSMPVSIRRYCSDEMERLIRGLLRDGFDHVVCDFIFPAANMPELERSILFQHNVETMIWRRLAERAPDFARRTFYQVQADRMFRYERQVCRRAGHVVAVSAEDARQMRQDFGISHVSEVPTGVDLDFFRPPVSSSPVADLVFVGAMDWLPNIDGVAYFIDQILPRIRRRRPETSVAIVGRKPVPEIRALADRDPRVIVTGTVADVRPFLWGGGVSIVPLRIGGGTRLKIYESMAACVPVVSTTIGAEGLEVDSPHNIRLADDPPDFAEACLELLEDAAQRSRVAAAGWQMVASRFSWDQVARCFERTLETVSPGALCPVAIS